MRSRRRGRERRCPSCAVTVRGDDARWCGSCGTPLDGHPTSSEAADPAEAAGRAGGRRGGRADGPGHAQGRVGPSGRSRLVRAGVVAGGAAVVLTLAVTGGGIVDRVASDRSAAVRNVAVAAPSEEVVEQLADRPPPPPPEPPRRTEAACTRGGTDDCFLWTAPIQRAYASGGHHLVVAGVVLSSEGPDLVARDLATGEERWRTQAIGALTPYQAEVAADGVFVVSGDDRRAEDIHAATAVVAGVDAATGEVLWRDGALRASMAPDGTTLLTTGEGHLRALEPDGSERWRLDGRIEPRLGESAWLDGHIVTVYEGPERFEQLRLTDGAPLGAATSLITWDAEATFVEIERTSEAGEAGEAGGDSRTVADLGLVGTDGLRWQVDGSTVSSCLDGVLLSPTVIELRTCAGERIDLSRADGAATTLPPDDIADADAGFGGSAGTPWLEQVGSYELLRRDGTGTHHGEDVLVTSSTTGAEVAVLPPETWIVSFRTPDEDVAGVVILATPDRLIALPPEERRWNGRSSGTSELRSLFAPATLSVQPR